MELVSYLIIWGEWSEDVLMYNKLSLGFLNNVYKPVIKVSFYFELKSNFFQHFYDNLSRFICFPSVHVP